MARGSWSAPATVGGNTNTLILVACSGTSMCLAIGNDGSYRYDGSTWTGPTAIPQMANAVGLSCPDPQWCLLTTLQGAARVWDGSAWSAPVKVLSDQDSSYDIDASACWGKSACAVLASGLAYVFNGQRWARQGVADPTIKMHIDAENSNNTIDPNPLKEYLTCPAAGSCVAVDSLGQGFVEQAGDWSKPAAVDPSAPVLTGLSCGSATFCLATAQAGDLYADDGSTWKAAGSTGLPRVGTVSCSSASFCLAGGTGAWATYDGSSWTPGPLSGSAAVQGPVTCPTDGFCVQVGAYGQAAVFKAGP